MLLFLQRLDKDIVDIAENDPVRVADAVINNLRLDNFKKNVQGARAVQNP